MMTCVRLVLVNKFHSFSTTSTATAVFRSSMLCVDGVFFSLFRLGTFLCKPSSSTGVCVCYLFFYFSGVFGLILWYATIIPQTYGERNISPE